MKIKGKHSFKCGDREQVWEKLTDIDYLAGLIADSKGLKQVGKNTYKGKLPLKAGPIKGKMATTFKLKSINKPKSFQLSVWGKQDKLKVSSKGKFTLSKKSGATASYAGSLKLSFKPAPFITIPVPDDMNKGVKKSLEKALASLFRKIEKQCCEENGNAH